MKVEVYEALNEDYNLSNYENAVNNHNWKDIEKNRKEIYI